MTMTTIAAIAAQYEISERQVRNYLKLVSEAHPGTELKADRQTLTSFAVEQIEEIRSIGPTAYARRHAAVTVHEPIAQPQPQPIAQPAAATFTPVVDVASEPAPGRPQLVWVNPEPIAQSHPAPIATYEPVPVVGLAVPGSVMMATHCQVENLIQVTDAMLDAIDSRFSIGKETIDAQRDATARRIEELRDKKTAINARARLYRQEQIEASVLAQHNAQTVGKLRSEVMADGQALGFQLSVQC